MCTVAWCLEVMSLAPVLDSAGPRGSGKFCPHCARIKKRTLTVVSYVFIYLLFCHTCIFFFHHLLFTLSLFSEIKLIKFVTTTFCVEVCTQVAAAGKKQHFTLPLAFYINQCYDQMYSSLKNDIPCPLSWQLFVLPVCPFMSICCKHCKT